MAWLPFIVVAFLAGSIPFGYLIGRAKGVDLRAIGSGNIGATNLGRACGRPFFFVCFVLDFLKGLLPVVGAGWWNGRLGAFVVPAADAWCWLAVVAAAVLGHVFSPWLGFRGGKGVATGLGAVLGVFPALTMPGLGSLAVFLVVLALWRYVSAASIAAAVTLPLWTWYTHAQVETSREAALVARSAPNQRDADSVDAAVPYAGWPFVAVTGLLAGLVVYKHRANIARLSAGTEPMIGRRREGGESTPEAAAAGEGEAFRPGDSP